jgi:membrane-associated phospholipid phosphatase
VTDRVVVDPAEDRLAQHLQPSSSVGAILHRLGTYDRRAYVTVAQMSTPLLDEPLSRLSTFANHSKPWFLIAGVLALTGGPQGRRAAATGVAAIAAASLISNQPMKLMGRRKRPARQEHGVPEARWVPMPTSTSFPSGHSASAAAFAVAVGDVVPSLRWPLRFVAGAVCFSRVYTGVHYPGDVIAGATTGAALGWLTARAGRRLSS